MFEEIMFEEIMFEEIMFEEIMFEEIMFEEIMFEEIIYISQNLEFLSFFIYLTSQQKLEKTQFFFIIIAALPRQLLEN